MLCIFFKVCRGEGKLRNLLLNVSFQGCDCTELLDWLFDKNDGILRNEDTEDHSGYHSWSFQEPNVCDVFFTPLINKFSAEIYLTF